MLYVYDKVSSEATSGFTLIEITLAMMVIAVGVLAIFSLFPAGLDQGARAQDDTYAALFAQEVFSAFRVQAQVNWNTIGNGVIPVAVPDMWRDGSAHEVVVEGKKLPAPALVFTNLDSRVVNNAFRYNILIDTNDHTKVVRVYVWAGEYGSTNAPEVFYTEFYDF